MRHTRPGTLIGIALLSILGGFVLDSVLVASRQPAIVPPVVLGLALLAIGGIIVVLAVPIRQVARGTRRERIDPYYATRVLLLAKASSLSGALFGGAAGGVLIFMLTRGVAVAVGSVLPTIIAVVGGAGLLVAGIIAERMCTVPPGDDDEGGPGAQPV
ncbi:DUF3180 domain-containing protein [Frigoribacterium sp. 2-23]|uniref:DUF3180 domain-containing protein n=1 Tax=Frigoribacterium sp. 2-23 TaxID=3415006 RepID=UPI003C6EE1E1